jgi:putative spermidine/putrescine transport system substrate-binding protein
MSVTPDRLSVLSWAGGWGAALRAAVSDPFERETGVRVEHATHVGLKLPEGLCSALAGGARPPVDVVWCNSVPALRAARAGWCTPFDEARMPELGELRPRARPPDGARRYVVHPYVVYYVLAFHEHAFPDGPPESWSVLLEPRHRGRVALYPGGNGFYPIAQVLGGGRVQDIPHAMTACWSFLRRLRPQVGEVEYSIGMEERLRRRELDLCFRALTNALAFRAAGVAVDFSVPAEGTTDTVDALWVPRGMDGVTRDLAMRYIAFALRREVQEEWCERLGAMPVHPAAAVPSVLRRADLPTHADDHRGILHVAERLKVEHEAEWESRFRQTFA